MSDLFISQDSKAVLWQFQVEHVSIHLPVGLTGSSEQSRRLEGAELYQMRLGGNQLCCTVVNGSFGVASGRLLHIVIGSATPRKR